MTDKIMIKRTLIELGDVSIITPESLHSNQESHALTYFLFLALML